MLTYTALITIFSVYLIGLALITRNRYKFHLELIDEINEAQRLLRISDQLVLYSTESFDERERDKLLTEAILSIRTAQKCLKTIEMELIPSA